MGVAPSVALNLEVSLAKGTVVFRIIVCVAFLAGGISMWRSGVHPIVGVMTAMFSACALYFGFRLLMDTRPGLVLDGSGLTINGRIGSGGTVPWSDISGLALTRYGHDYQLVVNVTQPEKYLVRGGIFLRIVNSLSAKIFGSPVRLNAGFLDYDRDALLRVANEYRAQYGAN
jgi:hypothetical protein